MYDILPFPNMTGTSAEEKISQIYNYLIQLKETLEFELTNISPDNLSQDLIEKINSLGSNFQKNSEEMDEQIQQVASNSCSVYDVVNSPILEAHITKEIKENSITVSDVLESDGFDKELGDKVMGLNFTVNMETGLLEYTIS